MVPLQPGFNGFNGYNGFNGFNGYNLSPAFRNFASLAAYPALQPFTPYAAWPYAAAPYGAAAGAFAADPAPAVQPLAPYGANTAAAQPLAPYAADPAAAVEPSFDGPYAGGYLPWLAYGARQNPGYGLYPSYGYLHPGYGYGYPMQGIFFFLFCWYAIKHYLKGIVKSQPLENVTILLQYSTFVLCIVYFITFLIDDY